MTVLYVPESPAFDDIEGEGPGSNSLASTWLLSAFSLDSHGVSRLSKQKKLHETEAKIPQISIAH